ncbi:MAG: divergent polysaccharide deacetylase family protein [Rhizomicrobium sp.]
MRAYAVPVPDNGKPHIAIVISGLGMSAKQTAAALASLPPQVTLAFAPYASDVQRWVAEARREGHEVLLEVPMEQFDFPDSDPGAHTLRSGAAEDANTERLVWGPDALHRLYRRDQSSGRAIPLRSGFARTGDDLSHAARASVLRQRRGEPFLGARRRGARRHVLRPGHRDHRQDPDRDGDRPRALRARECRARPRRPRPAPGSSIPSPSSAWRNGPRAFPAGALFWCPLPP